MATARRQTRALASLDGLIPTAPRLFASKLVATEAIAQDQTRVPVQQTSLAMIVEHQYASNLAQMEGGVWLPTLASARQDIVVMTVACPSATRATLFLFISCQAGCWSQLRKVTG